MGKFTVTIDTDNAAFADDPGHEVGSILRRIADNTERGMPRPSATKTATRSASTASRKEIEDMTTKLTHADLRQFTGTGQWFRHSLMRTMTYTEGVQYLAETGGAYWLVDKVATLQLEPKVRTEEFQSWKLKVNLEKTTAALTCDDGNGNIVHSETIDFTDFPLDEVELWVEGNVILLPSEH
ncbi:DUF6876 family protein [Bradyrhizobium sp. S3.9.1]|uniref:DUF6876 family protein n=1 Tax=Bradyrhizobium sp. S3.9.1 TaxID=3156431 RepID=UPI003396793B